MIRYVTGNIFDSEAQALVNTVNTVGVMGKGIALQFKKAFPNNYKAYVNACRTGEVQIGKIFVFRDSNLSVGEKLIINFPTKKHWRNPSEYSYIEAGLVDLTQVIIDHDIQSVALPPLGSGNGGLDWQKVKKIIESHLALLPTEIIVYEPSKRIKEQLKSKRVKLTRARALLLFVLFDLVKQGEYVSEFSSEKVCYFLQKFGAKKYFKLSFLPRFYGPYSGKVRFMLNAMNGSYLMGYSDMNKKPFEPLTLVPDAYELVKRTVEANPELQQIAQKTTTFLNGFYSDFSLELLSSIDYLANEQKTLDQNEIKQGLAAWSGRKQSLFANDKYLKITINHLKQFNS